jgi:hypothetical protein
MIELLPSERLAHRNQAFERLRDIDRQLELTFSEAPSTRAASAARELLARRAGCADYICELGGQPGAVPTQVRSHAC